MTFQTDLDGDAKGARPQSPSEMAVFFFAKSKLSLQKWIILIFWWSQQYPVKDTQRIVEINK